MLPGSGAPRAAPYTRLPVPEPAELERRTTELLQRLIRFNTVNPPGNEQAVQEFLKEVLEEAGFECELLSAVEGRPNQVARLRGRSDGPRLAYLGHVDTVLADPEAWSVDPWSGELRDGCVWGRGALDMKSQVAAEVAAVTALAEEGWRPEAGELMLVLTADEEAGATHGAKWLCEEVPDRVRCDLVVNEGGGEHIQLDGRRVYGVCVAEKGVFRFKLITEGRPGHASIPRIGDNALTKMAPILQAMSERQPSLESTPEAEAFLGALGLEAGDLREALDAVTRKDPRVAVLVEPMLGVTLAPTRDHRVGEDQRHPRPGGAAGGLPGAARARGGARPRPGGRGDRRRWLPARVRETRSWATDRRSTAR